MSSLLSSPPRASHDEPQNHLTSSLRRFMQSYQVRRVRLASISHKTGFKAKSPIRENWRALCLGCTRLNTTPNHFTIFRIKSHTTIIATCLRDMHNRTTSQYLTDAAKLQMPITSSPGTS